MPSANLLNWDVRRTEQHSLLEEAGSAMVDSLAIGAFVANGGCGGRVPASHGSTERHVLVDCAWRRGVSTWAASCTCGWQSGPREYYEDALEDFAQHLSTSRSRPRPLRSS